MDEIEADARDRELVEVAATAVVDRNRAHAAQLEAIWSFHARRVAEVEARDRGEVPRPELPGFFLLTPLEATKAEFAPLLGVAEMWIQADLDLIHELKQWLPQVWALCLAGRLDLGRAQVVHAQLAGLADDAARAAYAEKAQEWIARHDDPAAPVHPVRRQLLQRAMRRISLKFDQHSEEESFAKAFKKRRVSMRSDENGMAWMSVSGPLHDVMRADYRLTLIAKRLRELPGEERTVEQIRADLMLDLVLGRATVPATDGELEEAEGSGQSPVEPHELVGRWARPIINVHAPMPTLMGVSDEPGLMAGGSSIPAELLRRIALDPASTWYRLTFDPRRGDVELSTDSYTPTEPIVRQVVARDPECVFPGCVRPATTCECDHRTPHPVGPTCTGNLQPLCRRHHRVKHSEGFLVRRNLDGSYTWTSRFGVRSHKPAPEFPQVTWPATSPGLWDDDAVVFEDPIPDSLWQAAIELSREAELLASAA
ncbi:HNH endonuclease signature motif containing protein [Nocardioides pakistanensis]